MKLIDSRTAEQKVRDKFIGFLKAQEWILRQTTSKNIKELYKF